MEKIENRLSFIFEMHAQGQARLRSRVQTFWCKLKSSGSGSTKMVFYKHRSFSSLKREKLNFQGLHDIKYVADSQIPCVEKQRG